MRCAEEVKGRSREVPLRVIVGVVEGLLRQVIVPATEKRGMGEVGQRKTAGG